jgi:hypothetical protein
MDRVIARLAPGVAVALCALALVACGKKIAKTPADTTPPPRNYPGPEASKADWQAFSKQRGAEMGKIGPRQNQPPPGKPTGPPAGKTGR